MPFHPPPALYDRVDQARWLTDMTKAELNAIAERLYQAMDRRTSRAEQLGVERAFWSLIAYLEREPEEAEEPVAMTGVALERITELEMKLGENLASASRIRVPRIDLIDIKPDPEAWYRFPLHLSRLHNVFPFRLHGRTVFVAMAEPANWEIWLNLHKGTGLRPLPHVASAREIERAIKRSTPSAYEPADPRPPTVRSELRDAATLDEEGLDMEFSRLPGVEELCRELIGRSIAEGRSDLILGPETTFLGVRAFTSAWEVVQQWPLNLWGPIQIAFRALAKVPFHPFEAESTRRWPFMGQDITVWFHWYRSESAPQLGISLVEPEADA